MEEVAEDDDDDDDADDGSQAVHTSQDALALVPSPSYIQEIGFNFLSRHQSQSSSRLDCMSMGCLRIFYLYYHGSSS